MKEHLGTRPWGAMSSNILGTRNAEDLNKHSPPVEPWVNEIVVEFHGNISNGGGNKEELG